MSPPKTILLFLLILAVLRYVSHLSGQTETSDVEVEFALDGSGFLNGDLSVAARPGIRYTLLWSSDLEVWEEVDGVDGVEGDVSKSFQWESSDAAGFFKVRLELAESISSEITQIEYPVHVFLPSGYSESTRDYPVIYATDGQWISGGFSQAVDARQKDLILVTIEQGPGNRRATDFLLPGVHDYFRFLEEEFLPAVESIYRVDTSERTLCGTSYGGLLVGLVFILDDIEAPTFKNYLSFDASFWSNASAMYALESERYAANPVKNATLYLTSATGRQNNHHWVNVFQNRIESREYEGLRIIRKSYPVEHNDVAQPSFEEALDLLFD